MDAVKERIKHLESERDNNIKIVRNDYQDKIIKTLIDGWNLREGETRLIYEDRSGYIEGIFKDLSRDLDITIKSTKCNGYECDGKVKANYIYFSTQF